MKGCRAWASYLGGNASHPFGIAGVVADLVYKGSLHYGRPHAGPTFANKPDEAHEQPVAGGAGGHPDLSAKPAAEVGRGYGAEQAWARAAERVAAAGGPGGKPRTAERFWRGATIAAGH
jgi:hypothetical protein